MYTREKLCRDQSDKSRKSERNPPSFSSTLLEEIYHSIDGNVENSRRAGGCEEISSFSRACLVEKWMEHEAAPKKTQEFMQDNDLIFFSSTSNSSDSSGALSSSDTEFFASTDRPKQKASCFTTRLKSVRTGSGSNHDDGKTRVVEDDLMKSKSRALKIYANLKKVKQPISPGGRLTSFINSLFNNANGKKSRNPDAGKEFRDVKSPAASCLSKSSTEKMSDGGQRRVRFEPTKMTVVGDSGRFRSALLPELKLNKKLERAMPNRMKGYNDKRDVNVFFNEDEGEDDDCLSDSSSDLFEIDHLSLFGSNRYSEELPVYETTHFDTNCAIASGLIR